MKNLPKLVLLAAFLAFAPRAFAQQWSNDPWVDALKQSMAEEIKAQEVIDYCEQDSNRHKKMCDGVNDHQKSTFMSYDQALKLGQQKLNEQERAEKAANAPQRPLSLAEYAQQQRLQTQATQVVYDYCAKQSDAKTQTVCKDKPKLVQAVMLRYEAKLSKEKQGVTGQAN